MLACSDPLGSALSPAPLAGGERPVASPGSGGAGDADGGGDPRAQLVRCILRHAAAALSPLPWRGAHRRFVAVMCSMCQSCVSKGLLATRIGFHRSPV